MFYYHASLRAFILGTQIKSVLSLLIYQKSLRISAGQQNAGSQALNVIASDAQFFQDSLSFANHALISPLIIIVNTLLAWFYAGLGPLALLPAGMLIIAFPIFFHLGKKNGRARAKSQAAADTRILLLREILSAMTIIKYYAWERPLGLNVLTARDVELDRIKASLYIRSWMLLWINVPQIGTPLVYFFKAIEAGPAGLDPAGACSCSLLVRRIFLLVFSI